MVNLRWDNFTKTYTIESTAELDLFVLLVELHPEWGELRQLDDGTTIYQVRETLYTIMSKVLIF